MEEPHGLTPDEYDAWVERASILEYDAHLSRDEAERRALEMVKPGARMLDKGGAGK